MVGIANQKVDRQSFLGQESNGFSYSPDDPNIRTSQKNFASSLDYGIKHPVVGDTIGVIPFILFN
jgi:hypothetical protein